MEPEHAVVRGRHEAVVRVVMMAVRTVMMNWMMVFHRLRFLNIADSFLGHLRSHRLHRGHRFCKVTQKALKTQKEGFA